jgi:hypothetical protein
MAENALFLGGTMENLSLDGLDGMPAADIEINKLICHSVTRFVSQFIP